MAKNLSEEQKSSIEHMRGVEGRTCRYIAEALSLKTHTIERYCTRNCIENPFAPQRAVNKPCKTHLRNGKIVVAFTPKEDEMLYIMEKGNTSYAQIARILGRHRTSVRQRFTTLARREERALERKKNETN